MEIPIITKKVSCSVTKMEDMSMKGRYTDLRCDDEKAKISKEFGAVIREKRKKANVSQEELADFLNVTKATISRYESGTIEIPATSLILISSYCNFEFEEYGKRTEARKAVETLAKMSKYSYKNKTMRSNRGMQDMHFVDSFSFAITHCDVEMPVYKDNSLDYSVTIEEKMIAYMMSDSGKELKEFLLSIDSVLKDLINRECSEDMLADLASFIVAFIFYEATPGIQKDLLEYYKSITQ